MSDWIHLKDNTWAHDRAVMGKEESYTHKRWTETKSDWRWYWEQGLEHPCVSVTTILGCIVTKRDKEFLMSQGMKVKSMMERAGKIGTDYHKFKEDYDRGRKQGKKGSNKGFADMLRIQNNWEEAQELEVLSLEQSMIDPELGIAGTADKIVRCNGRVELWDYKTGSSWEYSVKASWQLCVYAIMAEKLLGMPPIEAVRVVHCDLKTGVFNPKGRLIEAKESIDGCYNSFMHLFAAWKAYNHTSLLRYGIRDPVDYKTVYKWPVNKVFNKE